MAARGSGGGERWQRAEGMPRGRDGGEQSEQRAGGTRLWLAPHS